MKKLILTTMLLTSFYSEALAKKKPLLMEMVDAIEENKRNTDYYRGDNHNQNDEEVTYRACEGDECKDDYRFKDDGSPDYVGITKKHFGF